MCSKVPARFIIVRPKVPAGFIIVRPCPCEVKEIGSCGLMFSTGPLRAVLSRRFGRSVGKFYLGYVKSYLHLLADFSGLQSSLCLIRLECVVADFLSACAC